MKDFFAINRESLTTQIVWDVFEAYNRGVLIAVNSSKWKARNQSRNLLLHQISNLEVLNKLVPSSECTEEIFKTYQQLNMINALDIAQSIMYAKQNAYEFRDKAGKQLARVLSEHLVKRKEFPMKLASGELTTEVEKKISIFVRFYQELYKSEWWTCEIGCIFGEY